ncbi:hypothetical protein BHF71_00980 [Vulcanibacillus modesticaldus]|uniref:Polysaccharide biosynthesis protein C-terminal domain-containing protein n=1 Tax=Vulcanibacillus modesticaldus TaxID=337097 RepID=A0A1D2YVT0_9BACI|nr:flippase [Vulcanibacillus modesticaldus]OEF99781.1 hypothetical protein BHF71_00980 [Vulcanibacillus modesticaldus]
MIRVNLFEKFLINNHFIKKIIESFFGKVSYVLFTMIFSLVATRLYGVEAFGEYTYAFTLVSFIMIFAKAGLDNGLIYYIPKNGNKYVSLSFFINAILSLLLVVLTFYFITDSFVRLMLPLVWLLSMEQIYFGVYRATGKIKEYYFVNGFISILLRILLVIVFYFFIGKNAKSIALGVYFSFIFSIAIYFYQNKDRFNKIVYDKTFLRYSFPLVIAAIMGVMMDRIDIIMLGTMIDKKSVGIYQIAVQVANLTSVILVIFNTVFAPQISSLYHKGKLEELRKIYMQSTRILSLISLVALIFIVIFSKYILLVFGEDIVAGQFALVLRSIGQFINAAVGSVWLMLAMTGKPKLQMYGNFTASVINIVLNFLLIPRYGINGAAFASMIAIGFVNILGYLLVSREFKVKVYGVI